jgi:hypothetical protein
MFSNHFFLGILQASMALIVETYFVVRCSNTNHWWNVAMIWTLMRIQLKSHHRLLCLLWLRCLVDFLVLCDELGVFFQQDAIDCHYQVSFPHQKIVIALMHCVRIWNCWPKTSKSRLLEDIFVLITHLSYLSCLKTLSAVLEMILHKLFTNN